MEINLFLTHPVSFSDLWRGQLFLYLLWDEIEDWEELGLKREPLFLFEFENLYEQTDWHQIVLVDFPLLGTSKWSAESWGCV